MVGQSVYGDGIFYWSFARSIVIDHDINVGNEVLHHYSYNSNNSYKEPQYPKFIYQQRDRDYRLPIGASLSWIPIMFLASGIGNMFNIFGLHAVLNGYSNIYQIFVGIENIAFILFGLYFVYLLLRKLYEEKIALLSVFILFFASNLFYYGSLDVINSHPFIFFISSLFAYFFFTKFSYKVWQWLVIGILVGLLTLTRNQDIIFLLLPFVALVKVFFLKRDKISHVISPIVFTLIGLFTVLSPQLLLWRYAYGGFFKSSYITKNAFDFLHPHILGVLFNSQTGLFFTSPIVLVGILGLIFLAKQKKYIGIIGLIIFCAEYFVISSWSSWDQAASYGIRMLISTYPFVAVGLGAVFRLCFKRYSTKLAYFICVILIIFNIIMIGRYQLFIKTATIDMGKVTRIEAQQKLNNILHTHIQLFN